MSKGIYAASGPDGQNIITLTICFNWSAGACQDGVDHSAHRVYLFNLNDLGGATGALLVSTLAAVKRLVFIRAALDGPATGATPATQVAALVGQSDGS